MWHMCATVNIEWCDIRVGTYTRHRYAKHTEMVKNNKKKREKNVQRSHECVSINAFRLFLTG